MKKYWKQLPLIIYPYAYLIYLFCLLNFKFLSDVLSEGMFIAIVAYGILTLITVIINIISAARGSRSAYEAAKINCTVKCWHIPAYIFHFILGCVGLLASVWGLGFIMIAVVVDVLTIAVSGLNFISCAVRMKKDGIMSTRAAVLCSICSFIFVADVFVAIFCVIICRRHENKLRTSL